MIKEQVLANIAGQIGAVHILVYRGQSPVLISVVFPMAVLMAVLLVVQLLLLIFSCSPTLTAAVTIQIDADNGTDTQECVTGPAPPPCKSLQHAVSKTCTNTTFLLLSDHPLVTIVNFSSCHNVTITGQHKQLLCDPGCSDRKSTGCGLLFENCGNLTLENITAHSCSVLLNITYREEVVPIRSGVVIKNGTGFTILNSFIASENIGFGTVLVNTGHQVSISNSTFTNNTLPLRQERGGGGLFIILSCSPMESTCPSMNWRYNIMECTFLGNHQEWKYSFNSSWSLSYGGGLHILLGLNSANNSLSIRDCVFKHNHAPFGAGMFIMCERSCINNLIEVNSSTFEDNFFEEIQGGAGVAVGITNSYSQQSPHDNLIVFYNSRFSHNSARYGAGTLIFGGRELRKTPTENFINFTDCSWSDNTGPISPAVDLAPDFHAQDETRFIVNVTFTDCTFDSNHVTTYEGTNRTQTTLPPHYHRSAVQQLCGVFLVTKLPVYFSGTNKFTNNTGTALYLISSLATFYKDSATIFTNNSGWYGGAVALYAFSQLQYRDNTLFHFDGNSASFGGAIFVRTVDQRLPFASYTCFLSYFNKGNWISDLKPTNVTFEFYSNKASALNTSKSMYLMTSVVPCLRACNQTENWKDSPENIFRCGSCLGNFSYGQDSPDQIATDGFMAVLKLPIKQSLLTIIPGVLYQLPIDVYDYFMNNVTSVTVYTAQLDENCHHASIGPAFTNVANNYIKLHGQPMVNCNLSLTIIGVRGTLVQVPFNLSWCRPGYVLDNEDHPNLSSCVCSASLGMSYHYNGITRCNNTISAAIIDPGLWVGYDNQLEPTQDNLFTAICPYCYCNNSLLQLKVSSKSLEVHMCDQNRRGFLCGECRNQTSVFFNSLCLRCRSNTNCHLGPLFYIVCELLPISVVFIIIIVGDISLTSGVAYSMVFLAQMVLSYQFFGERCSSFYWFFSLELHIQCCRS